MRRFCPLTLHALCLVLLSPPIDGAAACRGADGSAERLSLPTAEKWDAENAEGRDSGGTIEVVAPLNYKIARIVSPAVPAKAGEAFTLAAEARTRFPSRQSGFYRFWLQLECLRDGTVIHAVTSPELVDTQENEQLLAVTALAPPETTAVRALLCAQNKFWSPVENQALLRDLRLLRLNGSPGGTLEMEIAEELSTESRARTATLVIRGDSPDATGVAISTTRGTAAPTVLLIDGRAELPLTYTAEEVGRATVAARLGETEIHLQLTDPRAATLSIERVTADGVETPVLVQLIQQGEMLPGRYQETAPGIFVTPPWSTDLAPGEWQLRISRGPQFQSLEQTLQCTSGESINLGTLGLTRSADLPALGWYGGDGDGDVYHGEAIYQDVNAKTAADVAQAMGLDWVGVGRWGVGPLGGPNPQTWEEARAFMRSVSHPRFLFMWTDERPKTQEGHACFVGLERPDADRFGWGWTGSVGRPLRNFEMLQVIRSSGGATYANHPLRWWMKGPRFNTNMYSSLPFDLCAAGLIDGVNINDKPAGIELWSMLLDHGYRVAATAGADYCLDRPAGPPPGLHRMYCYCPEGMSPRAVADAVRSGHTIVSTGPVLLADLDGRPPGSTVSSGKTHRIQARGWARGDHPDASLERLELWAHGRVIETRTLAVGAQKAETVFEWKPEGKWDWVAVRAVARGGWAMTSAFYAAAADYQPPRPVTCQLTLDVRGLSEKVLAGGSTEVWNAPPGLVTARQLSRMRLKGHESLEVPVTATVVIRLADGRHKELSVYDATGVSELIEAIAAGAEQEKPLLQWNAYEEVLQRSQTATAEVTF